MELNVLMNWSAIVISVLTLFGILYKASKDTKSLRRDHNDLHRDNTDLRFDHNNILDVAKSVKSDTNNLSHHQGVIQSQITILLDERKEKFNRLNGLTYEQNKVNTALSEIAVFNEVMQRTQADNQRLLDEKRLLEVKVQNLKQENEKLILALAKYRHKDNQCSRDNGFER
ncbi:hypothetical protein [Latilactobacillus fragifolii]|uniref:hypothetical protein n=1 Tax=Latilactobacillus fragifolii TaxID=2814244 RepID=UPI001ABA1E32|nr:hypothetical protein [Latilactobacillus fragifolii]